MSKTTPPNTWITVAEAAARAEVSKQAILDAIKAGKIQAKWQPGPTPYQLVDPADVDTYTQNKKRRQTT